MIVAIFILWRILLFIGAFCAQKFVPYLGFFPYKEILIDYKLPIWISSFANFDGLHYLLIARQNYSQYEQAFFPLYPLLMYFASFLIPNVLLSGLLISNFSFAIGLLVFQKYFLLLFPKKTKLSILAPIFLILFPTAFFFGSVYTEGLFFLLSISALYFLEKKNVTLFALFAALSSATRLMGIFLAVPFLFHYFSVNKCNAKKTILIALTPFIGLVSFMFYLWKTTGDPLFFFTSQPLFGANRSTHLIILPQVYFRYIKILLIAQHDFRWYMSLFEMCIFTFVFIILTLDLIAILKSRMKNIHVLSLLGINIFSFINLVLPTFTGTFSSIPRYALFSFSFFLYLSQIRPKKIQWALFILFGTLQIALLSLFIQGYFIG